MLARITVLYICVSLFSPAIHVFVLPTLLAARIFKVKMMPAAARAQVRDLLCDRSSVVEPIHTTVKQKLEQDPEPSVSLCVQIEQDRIIKEGFTKRRRAGKLPLL